MSACQQCEAQRHDLCSEQADAAGLFGEIGRWMGDQSPFGTGCGCRDASPELHRAMRAAGIGGRR